MTDSARTDAAAQPGAWPGPGEPGPGRRPGEPAAPGHRDDHFMLSRLGRLGRWCARHPWPVVAVWAVVLVGVTFGHRALGGSYSDNFSLPNSPSQAGAELLQQHPTAGIGSHHGFRALDGGPHPLGTFGKYHTRPERHQDLSAFQ